MYLGARLHGITFYLLLLRMQFLERLLMKNSNLICLQMQSNTHEESSLETEVQEDLVKES